MTISTVMLILNVALIAILVLGFLFGLKGAKKSALSLAFFIGALVVTLIITPWVTNALLQISINVEGETVSIRQAVINALQEDATIKELASKGSNTEALINNMPQLLGNLVTYMLLLVVVGIIFWIAYLITAHFIFKKDKQNKKALKAKNPISKTAPNNVSATGNVTYVRTEPVKRKHRLFGGLIGAVHALVFFIAFLVPVCGTAKLINQYAYQTEEVSTTASIGLLDASIDTYADTDDSNYTPSAKFIQEKLPTDLLTFVKELDTSFVGNVCGIANTNNIWYNSIAKCKVKGEKIVLSNEIDAALTVYDNVEFLSSIDFNDVESLRSIDFAKVKKAVTVLGNSSILKSIAPEIANTYLKWITEDDISYLDPTIQSSVQDIRTQLDEEPNLKELVIEIQKMFADEDIAMSTITQELLNLVDTAEIVIKSDLIYEVVKDQMDLDNLVTILHANSNALMNSLIDQLYKSEFVNLTTLTLINYGLDALQGEFEIKLEDNAVQVGKIVLKDAVDKVDSSVIKSISNFALDLYSDIYDCNELKTTDDVVNFIETYSTSLCTSLSVMLDNIKNMGVLKQFNILPDIIDNVKQFVVFTTVKEGAEVEKYVEDYLNLDCILDSTYSFSNDFNKVIEVINAAKALTFTEGEGANAKTVTLIYKLLTNDGLDEAVKSLSEAQLSSIVTPASYIYFLKPGVNKLLNQLFSYVSDSIGDVADIIPPDIDISDHVDEILEMVDDVKQVADIVDKLNSLENDATLKENLRNELTDEEKDSVASLLNSLQNNSNNDGIFKEAYSSIVENVTDDSKSGLDGLAEIVEKHTETNGETTIIDWQAVVNEYLKQKA